MRLEPWEPTMAQKLAANRLAANVYHGARVKTRPDGIAEARTIEKGENRHYQISRDGRVTLLEAEPTRSYLLGYVFLIIGTVSIFTMVLLVVVLQVAHIRTESELGWVIASGFIGFVFGFVGQGLLSPPSAPGELWLNIGAPED